jgi:alcohol dehydrogenase
VAPTPTLITNRTAVEGWYAGTVIDEEDPLRFSEQAGVRSMNEVFPLERAAQAYQRMLGGKVRFRAVLAIGS